MCILHSNSATVNSERRQLFDVVGFDSLGQPQVTVGQGLPLQAAISRSLGFNANPGRFIAAVVPSATTEGAEGAEAEQNVFDRIVEEREAERATTAAEDSEPSSVTVYMLQVEDETGIRRWFTESMDLETAHEMYEKLLREERKPALWSIETPVSELVSGRHSRPRLVRSPERPDSPTVASSEPDDSEAKGDAEDAAESNLVAGRDVEVWLIRYICPVTGERVWWRESLTKKYARAICRHLRKRGLKGKMIRLALGQCDLEAFTGLPSRVKDARARFVQSAVRSQLEVIRQALPHVSDSGDIGLLAMSLREVAKQVDGIRETGSITEVPDDWGFDEAMGPEGWANDELEEALGLREFAERSEAVA